MSIYLEDISLPRAKEVFKEALFKADLLRVLGKEIIKLNEYAVGTSGIKGRGDEAISYIVIAIIEAFAHLQVDQAVTDNKELL